MDKKTVLEIINKSPVMQLATVDSEGRPHTRGMMPYSADETGIVFHTGSFKPLYKEILNNQNLEVSFFDQAKMLQIRVSGVAKEITDQAFKEKIVSTPGREFLKPWIERQGYDMLKVFKIENCRAVIWTMATNFEYPQKEVVF
ncbi:pyridoxamine 5'-phosphate oxidase [candidate division WOR-1 bacterium RIFOXYB2_FULL_42_35]|uniref:Pyridoxamine 5'-phosphate oxidase n=1 Tax=candidate division WOR-1 bacterium RIFOXYC2_FULL_41_25 TaxID=1802586 RepID=A0A1F4TKQ2_UNCSA|nr:MAG: pyridoxamine 5'-phosphate oxidase [candidate division WOR-1 bacterium RIFOXYA2_FULL_41_14]OGC21620.1 MAG: pyridoxamine 5'-phosphate oxidase [candidate division WOR-1 bacterium RIFOXYB2_FULL_42_35]OGC32623.1 MAG: pyridoxamine 5'-phosphate oxidase [candidate division WOR-1 bacterium RIFOXYC2_FULL_41_25]OGC41496.1 MAG: pyridoxamine 5'-phosphate oxidase [candidate division WOR-1 bacterium RIFOXYD2_FULL_41_8]